MAEPKTRPTSEPVSAFLDRITDPEVRKDAKAINRIMARATGCRAVMWGAAIVGFGSRPIRYASGKTLDWPVAGFSPRKGTFSLYLAASPRRGALLRKFGKHKTGKGCIYFKRLADVDAEVLEALVADAAG